MAYSSDGRTSVEYAVAFTSGSHWYNVLLTKLSILVALFTIAGVAVVPPLFCK